jgi:hypothetical protein
MNLTYQKGFTSLAVVLVLVGILTIAGIGGYYLSSLERPTNSSLFQRDSQKSQLPVQNNEIVSWKKYVSEKNLYAFQHPDNWVASELEKLELKSNNHTVITIEILKDPKEKFDYCVINPLEKRCEWIKDRGLQTIIDWGSDNFSPEALVTVNTGRYALVSLIDQTLVDRQTFRNFLATFKPIVVESLEPWSPVCRTLNMDEIKITIEKGDGLTHIARKALRDYLNTIALSNVPKKSTDLLSEEKVYVEDYIRRSITVENLTVGKNVIVPCKLVEEAVVKVRSLTVQQKKNLEKYGQNVTEYQLSETLRQIIEESFRDNKLKPQTLELE